MPTLTIIAGPNGAGKSAFSSTLVAPGTQIFDGDKYLTLLKQQFPETGSDILNNYVNDHDFASAKLKAFANHHDFAFETNFNADDPMQTFRQFKSAGYTTQLIFIGMGNTEDCIQRVSIRVKGGGHKVPEPDIITNYTIGLKNLELHLTSFDRVVMMDNSIPESNRTIIPNKIAEWSPTELKYFTEIIPMWIQEILKRLKMH